MYIKWIFFWLWIKIEVITYLIENDNDYWYKCLSNELLLNWTNIVFYIILPVELKDQNILLNKLIMKIYLFYFEYLYYFSPKTHKINIISLKKEIFIFLISCI